MEIAGESEKQILKRLLVCLAGPLGGITHGLCPAETVPRIITLSNF